MCVICVEFSCVCVGFVISINIHHVFSYGFNVCTFTQIFLVHWNFSLCVTLCSGSHGVVKTIFTSTNTITWGILYGIGVEQILFYDQDCMYNNKDVHVCF